MKTTLTLVALLAIAACSAPPVEKIETEAAVPVTVEPSKTETLTATISVTGTVVTSPGGEWVIGAPSQARILEIPKAEGDPVREGDLLVRFDIPTLGADVAARQAEVKQATARVTTARSKVTRLTNLQTQGVASQREIQEAQQEQAEAEAALAQAESAVGAAQSLAGRATVHARFNGVVAKRWHNPGDLVDASAGDPVLRVIDPKALQILAAVPMAQLARVGRGAAAMVIGPEGGDGVAAKVTTLPAQVDPSSATADVRLAFSSPTRLPAGAVVQVQITAEVRPNVIAVPTAAIVSEDDEIFVMVAGADNKAHKYPVVLGLSTHELTEIKSGLTAGLQVITRGQDGLPEGAAVKVQK